MQMKRLGHVAVCVEDVAKAAEFYKNLGMKLVWQDTDWAYLKAGNDGLALMSPDYDQAGPHFGNWFEYLYEPDDLFDKKEIETPETARA